MRHLLDTRTLAKDDAMLILDTAEDMAATQQREVKKLPTLRGKTVVNLFYEDSTRTRISFEAAAKRLSADVINFSAKGSSVSKGESLKDTAQTLQAIGADGVVIRHPASGAPERLARSGWIEAGVLNASEVTALIRTDGGYRFWGNRTCADEPLFAFESTVRVAQLLAETIIAGMVWAVENPNAGIVETDEMDHVRCLEVQKPYLGPVEGHYTNWTPLAHRWRVFDEEIDESDPWSFKNILAS